MPKKRAKKKREPLPESCPYCGHVLSEEEISLRKTHGQLTCPDCGREGCGECMQAGRGCPCLECEGTSRRYDR